MLRATALAFLAVLALLPAPASPQPAPGSGAVLELADPAGDVATQVNGAAGAGGQEAYRAADILGLRVEETATAILFRLQAAALPMDPQAGPGGVRYSIFLTHNTREFWIEVYLNHESVGDPI